MNWILGNKNKNSSHGTILQKAKLWWGGISRDKKIKTLGVVLFLVCVFCLAISTAYAADNTPAPTTKSESGFSITGAIIDLATALPKALIGMILAACQGVAIFIVSVATTIFAVTVDPSNMSGPNGILNQQALKDIWVTVRDTLNMFFILVLLFSAFCTIFQVEKWNLKKVWLNILINALLVNFSWTIARIIIDISNVAMYYFLNNMFVGTTSNVTGSSVFATIGTITKISLVLTPSSFTGTEIPKQIMMLIFTFILGTTLMAIAGLFVIRLIALALLIMFSPIGFVGYIFPATAEFADKWWKQLFSYAFFAPIMIFGIAIAIKITQAINDSTSSSFMKNASSNGGVAEGTWVSSLAFFALPIVVLWAVMGVAQSMGVAGADKVVEKSKALGKWASGAKFAQDTYKAYRARREQAKGDKWSNRIGNWAGNKQDQARGLIAPNSYGGQHATNRYNSAENARKEEEKKLHGLEHLDMSDLNNLKKANLDTKTGEPKNKYLDAAISDQLAEKGAATVKELDEVRKNFGETSQVFKQMQAKVKAYNPSAAFNHLNPAEKEAKLIEHAKSGQMDFKKLNADALADPKFLQIAMQHGNLKAEDLRDLSKKSDAHKNNINTSIQTLASDPANSDVDTNEVSKNIHLAHVAATGKIHNSLGPTKRAKIWQSMDKDTARNIDASELVGMKGGMAAMNVNPGKLNEIVHNMKEDASKQKFVQTIMNLPPTTSRVKAMQAMIKRDKSLMVYV